MPIKWLTFFFSTWLMLALIGMGIEQSFASVTASGGYMTVIDTLMSANIVTDVTVAGHTVFWLPNLAWFGALLKAFTFQFSFMQEEFVGWLAYLVIFLPIMLSVVVATLFSMKGSASS